MEKKFDVLSKDLNCKISHFLEASAGTGKTFAIEHIVARLLVEEDPFSLKEILVVTFTKAATKELKNRIHAKLRMLLNEEEDIERATRLRRAIASFEEAQIFTIHSFCGRMLKEFAKEADLPLHLQIDDTANNSKERKLVGDYLRFALSYEDFSREQIKRIFAYYDEEKLIDKIVFWMSKGREILEGPSASALFEEVKKQISSFGVIESEVIVNEFMKYAPLYEGICNRKREVKEEFVNKIEKFASLFSKPMEFEEFEELIAEGEPLSTLLAADKLKKSSSVPSFSPLFNEILKKVSPLIAEARSIHSILARLCRGCANLRRNITEDLFLTPDDILRSMQKSLNYPLFLQKVQKRFKAAIIDEFQDTDPTQWEIFKRCFVDNEKTICYLVGDPKQSIYAFRRADIYTYLSARDALKKGIRASLSVNYRSTIPLTNALNHLFTTVPWMPLPKMKSTLEVIPVEAKKEGLGGVHFFIGEEEKELFSFISKEIINLYESKQFQLKEIAILVKDRFQEVRLKEHFKECAIPSFCKRGEPLIEHPCFASLEKLFTYLESPHEKTLLGPCLIDPLFGWDLEEVKEWLSNRALFEEIENLKMSLECSLASFFEQLVSKRAPKLLQREEGLSYFRALQQLIELFLTKSRGQASPKECLNILNEIKRDSSSLLVAGPTLEAVNILTMHMSKGLEFEVVFALGLVSRTPQEEELIEDENGILVPNDFKSNAYLATVEERDAEKARQLYVTLTRAKKKLFVPILLHKMQEVKKGCHSPMELFLHTHLQGGDLHDLLESWKSKVDISYEFLSKCDKKKMAPQSIDYQLVEKTVTICKKGEKITSYSSLVKKNSQPTDHLEREYPAGAETGILLHEILEKLDFQSPSIVNEIRPILFGTSLAPFEEIIAEQLFATLHVSLGGLFKLVDVNPKHLLREIEFLIPSESSGFLTGFIDLVLFHDGKYTIIDWKSNLLPSYDQETLLEEMKRQGYDLQERIYRDALKKYLKMIDDRPFEECFGGSFYLFLRGINLSNQEGICYLS